MSVLTVALEDLLVGVGISIHGRSSYHGHTRLQRPMKGVGVTM